MSTTDICHPTVNKRRQQSDQAAARQAPVSSHADEPEEADKWPIVRSIKPVGSWEKKGVSLMPRPSIWEALL